VKLLLLLLLSRQRWAPSGVGLRVGV
jgi:hypothetical protein